MPQQARCACASIRRLQDALSYRDERPVGQRISPSAASEIITRDFYPWRETDVEREGYTWSVWIRESSDETGSFSSAVAYRDWPFSAEVVSNTKRAALLACNFIELRAPDTFRRVTALCGSSD